MPKGPAPRILLVEDELLVALAMQALLENLGYADVSIAGELSQAFLLLAHAAPDLAILDVNIGREKVFPFAAELRSRSVPFFFCTGEKPETFPAEWQRYPVIAKPVDEALLRSALEAFGELVSRRDEGDVSRV
jgi:CheY-like chemotaxis protein